MRIAENRELGRGVGDARRASVAESIPNGSHSNQDEQREAQDLGGQAGPPPPAAIGCVRGGGEGAIEVVEFFLSGFPKRLFVRVGLSLDDMVSQLGRRPVEFLGFGALGDPEERVGRDIFASSKAGSRGDRLPA